MEMIWTRGDGINLQATKDTSQGIHPEQTSSDVHKPTGVSMVPQKD